MADFSVSAENHIKKQCDMYGVPNYADQVKRLDHLPKEIRRNILKEARTIARNDVFGVGHKVGKEGPIEQGLGSWENPTQQSVEAYIKTQENRKGGPEPGYEQHLERMQARLREVEAQRRKARAAQDAELDD